MKGYLYLSNGETREGELFGAVNSPSQSLELVFSTGMTGYVESLTDPSFAGQILVMTYPLIGNYGVPREKKAKNGVYLNRESKKIWVGGLVVSDYVDTYSHADAVMSLSTWMKHEGIIGISGIDTRELTGCIREGTVTSAILSNKKSVKNFDIKPIHWVSTVSGRAVKRYMSNPTRKADIHLALIDCGVKHGILRSLLARGYDVTVVPWDYDPLEISHIDGVICSNGPSDPKKCGKTIQHIRKVVDMGVPFFGVCLGHQLLSLAIGADTYRMPYGHRGLNQPCVNLQTGRGYLTSQNHGYAVLAKLLPKGYTEWFINANDKTNEGICHEAKKVASVQFHPEGNPGPFDSESLFDFFKTV